jgi:hypothetical protein
MGIFYDRQPEIGDCKEGDAGWMHDWSGPAVE